MHQKFVFNEIRSFCGYVSRFRMYRCCIKNIASDNVVLSQVMGLMFLVTILSCKHEIPDFNNPSGGANPPATSNCSPDSVYFQQQVAPIFISNCAMAGCHDNITHKEGLILITYQGIMAGGIRPGDPRNSKLYKVMVATNPGDRMPPPPHNPMPKEQTDLVYKWISQGAKNYSCVSSVCDTAVVTYALSVRPIITTKCQGCHSSSSPGGGIDLSTYNGVKAIVNNGKLWGAVNFMNGFLPMPKNGTKLSTCELAKIEKWIDAGSLNN